MFAAAAGAQTLPRVRATPAPAAPKEPAGSDVAPPTITLTADDVVSRIGNETKASGDVEVKRLDTDLHADLVTYDELSDTAHGQGHVRINRGLDWFSADRVDLELTRSAGTLIGTEYELGARKAGGHAQRIELIDQSRSIAYKADYTSCSRDGPDEPDWIISGEQIDIDSATNEGKATHAVLRFLGVPILAAPSLTFPVTAERKSGFLPPTGDLSNRSGIAVSVPYYWNLEPNIDATLSTGASTRRGAELSGEARYLEPNDLGQVTAYLLPDDIEAKKSHEDSTRGAFEWAHEGSRADWLTYSARVQRVSDSSYWIDFPGQMPSLTQRLLPTDLSGTSRFLPFGDTGEIDTYARVQRFQTLQEPASQGETDLSSPIAPPFQRSPQIGARGNLTLPDRLRFDMEAEGDRFDLSDLTLEDNANARINEQCQLEHKTCPVLTPDQRVGGDRAHFIASVSRNFSSDWGRFEPKLEINGTTYRSDLGDDGTRVDATRWVPTLSGDSAFSFERQTELFGRDLVQTLEPRFLYVLTPRRDQFALPLYDTAPKDFNEVSIYSTNEFTGNDRISDENELTAGVATRLSDAANGRELLHLGIAQKFLFSKQYLTTSNFQDVTDQTPPPYTRKLSDLLLYGSSSAMESWSFDGIVDLNPFKPKENSDSNSSGWAAQRVVMSARYHPGPFKTLSLTYRFADNGINGTSGSSATGGPSKQYEVGGQWPVYHQPPRANGCSGTLYAVGRVDYSANDRTATYAIGGFEYDAGCWIGRVMVERDATGTNRYTNHVVLQLELNGLSTLGTGSLRVLKDNVPGYQPLRDDPGASAVTPNSP